MNLCHAKTSLSPISSSPSPKRGLVLFHSSERGHFVESSKGTENKQMSKSPGPVQSTSESLMHSKKQPNHVDRPGQCRQVIDHYVQKPSFPLWGFGVDLQASQQSQLEPSWRPRKFFHPLEAHKNPCNYILSLKFGCRFCNLTISFYNSLYNDNKNCFFLIKKSVLPCSSSVKHRIKCIWIENEGEQGPVTQIVHNFVNTQITAKSQDSRASIPASKLNTYVLLLNTY